MNDLLFQRQLQSDPHLLSDEMLAYLDTKPELKKMVKKTRDFDEQIVEALDVDVPEGLEARILLNQSYQDADNTDETISLETPKSNVIAIKPAINSWWAFGSMAASMLVVSFSMALWLGPTNLEKISANDVVAHVLHHVEEDPTLMTAFKAPTDQQDLQKLFLAVGASLNEPIDQMSYAGECIVKGQKGLHVVMQGEQGPVTVIVLPGQQLDSMIAFESSGFQGELLPVKGGVVAIIGNSMEQLSEAHMRFFKSVKFV